MKILGLPGFLGLRTDFDDLYRHLRKLGLPFQSRTWALSSDLDLNHGQSWSDWTSWGVQELQRWKSETPLVGIGYSMGGRLLLSLAESNPGLFDCLVFLSVHPGLSEQKQRALRLESDLHWASRFESEEWSTLMSDWGSQSVFQGGAIEPVRPEVEYSRPLLARVMRDFSLALQPDYRPVFSQWKTQQLWMAGEKDPKFAGFLEELKADATKRKGTIHFEIVPSAGHRLLLENPNFVAEQVFSSVRGFIGEPG